MGVAQAHTSVKHAGLPSGKEGCGRSSWEAGLVDSESAMDVATSAEAVYVSTWALLMMHQAPSVLAVER